MDQSSDKGVSGPRTKAYMTVSSRPIGKVVGAVSLSIITRKWVESKMWSVEGLSKTFNKWLTVCCLMDGQAYSEKTQEADM